MPEILHLTPDVLLFMISSVLTVAIIALALVLCKDIIKDISNKKQNKQ